MKKEIKLTNDQLSLISNIRVKLMRPGIHVVEYNRGMGATTACIESKIPLGTINTKLTNIPFIYEFIPHMEITGDCVLDNVSLNLINLSNINFISIVVLKGK